MTGRQRRNIALVTIPIANPKGDPVIPLVEILKGACDELYIVTAGPYLEESQSGTGVHTQKVRPVTPGQHWMKRLSKYVAVQIKTCANLKSISGKIDIVVFAAGSTLFLLTLLMSKLLRKKIVSIVVASEPRMARVMYRQVLWGLGGAIFHSIFKLLERINCSLSDKVVVSFETTIDHVGLRKYGDKVVVGNYNNYYLRDCFDIRENLGERGDNIGYVGRLSREKGVLELVEAIPLVIRRIRGARFLIVGDGPMAAELKNSLEKSGCLEKVTFTGWASPDEVADYLNQMKFFILPSYTEAGSRTCLEAMACGAIVLGSAVGGLLSMVADGQTGFLLRDNRPHSIAERLAEVWNHPGLNDMQRSDNSYVKNNFSYEKAVASWRGIFNSLSA
jgi:glycosyltransferase involved in cell wall biosynthesis